MGVKSLLNSNSTLSFLGNLFVSVAGMINFMLIARLVSTEELGQYAIFLAASTFLEMIRLGLTHNGLIRFLATDSELEGKQLIGTSYLIGLSLAVLLAIILTAIYNSVCNKADCFGAYHLFMFWYPVFSIVTFPLKNTITLLQADLKFGLILVYRILNIVPLTLYLVWAIFTPQEESINNLMVLMIFSSGILSLVTIILRRDGADKLKYINKRSFDKLFQFGKFNSLTLLGTNLLQSIDMFLIGLSPLGSVAVAIYSIPLKYIEVMQMPLRSLVAAAYPLMAKLAEKKDWVGFKQLLYSRSGFLFIAFIPICLILIILAPWFIKIIAGNDFYEANGILSSRLLILFAIVALFMPFDKFSGAALDAMNRPQSNTKKVFIMLLINTFVDVIALWGFSSLNLMAVGSILYTLAGGIVGYYFLSDKFTFSPKELIKEGISSFNILFSLVRF